MPASHMMWDNTSNMTNDSNPSMPCNFTIEGIMALDDCAIGVIAGGGALVITIAVLLMCIAILCCCKRSRRRRNREAHDKETSETIRMTSISKRDDHRDRNSAHDDDNRNAQLSSKSTARTTDEKKANTGKGKKQIRDSTDRDKDFSIDRTASEGASGKTKVSLTYKRAQDPENRDTRVSNKRKSDMYRSASYSVVGGTQKDKEKKKLPAIPPTAGDVSKHGYDKVKGPDTDKSHKYANVDLGDEASTNMGIMEPKYDEVDKETTKKGHKMDKDSQKGKPRGGKTSNEHFYHTLEESLMAEEAEGGIKDEEYSSPTRKALVVSKVTIHDKSGKGLVLSTDDDATVKGTKIQRAKSHSEKKSSKKDGNKKDHEYDQPSHNTLPHRPNAKSGDDNKECAMMKGSLTPMFDDPTYVASADVSAGPAGSTKTTPTSPQPPPRESCSPKRASAEMPTGPVQLRKTEPVKQPTDDHKYDEPNEKKGARMTKKAIYSSKLFDDPKYEEGFPNN